MQKAHHPPPSEAEETVPLVSLWAAALGALVLGGLFILLPEKLTLGPKWLPLVLIILVELPVDIARIFRKKFPLFFERILNYALLGIITIVLTIAVMLLISNLIENGREVQAQFLLRDGLLLWVSNVLVFSLWFWGIDGGGARKRHKRGHLATDLLFPQQTDTIKGGQAWAPHYLDYLFVAFTTATALSPTDTLPLSRRAKMLMMIEAVLATTIVLIIVARAINIL